MKQIIIFFLTTIILTSALLGFIFAVDPYDKYGNNPFALKTKAVAMARENKFNMIEYGKKQYGLILLGSSSAHRFHTDDLKAYTGLTSFNYAVQHTTPEDYLAVTRHILKKQKPKMLMLQMDFYALNKNFPTDTRFYTSPLKPYLVGNVQAEPDQAWLDQDYFTLGAISDSFKVIWINFFGKVRHLYLEDGNYQKEKPFSGPIQVTQFAYKDYETDSVREGYLREIKKLCDENSIKLVVWTTPYSLEHFNMIRTNKEINAAYERYVASLESIFGKVVDFADYTEQKFNSDQYYFDSSHPNRAMSEEVLKKLKGLGLLD